MTQREIDLYLHRIGFNTRLQTNDNTLTQLHEQHIISVPFENIDIARKHRFALDLPGVFKKVVTNRRGGYCYELNNLFYHLLVAAGFKCKLISCRMFDGGTLGPEHDHVAMLVETKRRWLVDVGAGDLFIRPIDIDLRTPQADGDRVFTIEETDGEYTLVQHKDPGKIIKYSFDLQSRTISDFEEMSVLKQLDPGSYFVKNLVCTRAIPNGRITLFNDKLKHREKGIATEQEVGDTRVLGEILEQQFNIKVEGIDRININNYRTDRS